MAEAQRKAKALTPQAITDSFEPNENIPEAWADFASEIYIRSGLEMVQFVPYDYQLELDRVIDSHRGVVITKTRQMGFTEYVASKFLHKAARIPGYLALVFSKNQKDTRNIARRIRGMASAHPRLVLDGSSLEDLSIINGGRIVFLTSTPNAGRGFESVSDILYDECGFVSAIAEIYGATSPSQKMVGDRARTILLSTPNGQNGFYWEQLIKGNGDRDLIDLCRQMREDEIAPVQHWTAANGWAKFVCHYKAHPVYSKNPNFLQDVKEQDNLTESQAEREYNLGFDESGSRVFSNPLITKAIASTFAEPQWRHQYLVGIDPSFGGDDFYTVRVWDVTCFPYTLVAEFKDNRKSKDYYIARTIDCIEPYEPSLIAVETNSGGALYQQELIKERPEWLVEGVNMNNASKILHTDRLVLLLEREQLQAPAEALEEYKHFVESIDGSTRKREAESGHHDDSVMADAVAFAKLEAMPPLPDYTASSADDRPVYDVLSEIGI